MSNRKNFWTQKRPDGKWETKREGSEKASKITTTQEESWKYTREKARAEGGEAFLKNAQGQIRERNTYGKDPHPPKG